jgi:hypothetical protein
MVLKTPRKRVMLVYADDGDELDQPVAENGAIGLRQHLLKASKPMSFDERCSESGRECRPPGLLPD